MRYDVHHESEVPEILNLNEVGDLDRIVIVNDQGVEVKRYFVIGDGFAKHISDYPWIRRMPRAARMWPR